MMKFSYILVIAALLASFAAVRATAEEENGPVSGIPEGAMIIQGDILVPLDYFEKQDSGLQVQSCFDDNMWPGGIVPYVFSSNVTSANQSAMLDAMAEWEAVANVEFRPRNGENDYIFIQDSTQNSSYVGRQGGSQTVNIYNWGWRFIMAHELGHALGFWHEQSRPDRDTYVNIEWDNIESGKDYNFDKETTADVYGPYDFDSVMHYGQCAFSICSSCSSSLGSCRTITVKSPWNTQWQDEIGQRDHLSELDQLTMSMLYPESNWEFVDVASSEHFQFGTFFYPWKTFANGVSNVPNYGVVIIQPGTYSEAMTIAKPMTLRAPLGGVIIGN